MVLLAGKYELGPVLGEGGMGIVHAAKNVATGRAVAIKLLSSGGADESRRLLREASICGRLDHPNIVQVLDVGMTEQGAPFLVMELLRGHSLAERLAIKRLSHAEIVQVALGVARALATAHAAGIVHRDLKPANVFIHEDPVHGSVVKVVDFGVGKVLGGDDSSTTTGVAIGSPAYMSPEQARGEHRSIDARSDLWSFGVLLFELVAGRRPFQGATAFEVVSEILKGPIARLRDLVPDADPDLDAIVARCLVRRVDERASTAAEIIAALERKPLFEDTQLGGGDTLAFDPSLGQPVVTTGLIVAHLAGANASESSTVRLPLAGKALETTLAQGPVVGSGGAAGAPRPKKALLLSAVALGVAVAAIFGGAAWAWSRASTAATSTPGDASTAPASPPSSVSAMVLVPTQAAAAATEAPPEAVESATQPPSASASAPASAGPTSTATTRPLDPKTSPCRRDPKRCR